MKRIGALRRRTSVTDGDPPAGAGEDRACSVPPLSLYVGRPPNEIDVADLKDAAMRRLAFFEQAGKIITMEGNPWAFVENKQTEHVIKEAAISLGLHPGPGCPMDTANRISVSDSLGFLALQAAFEKQVNSNWLVDMETRLFAWRIKEVLRLFSLTTANRLVEGLIAIVSALESESETEKRGNFSVRDITDETADVIWGQGFVGGSYKGGMQLDGKWDLFRSANKAIQAPFHCRESLALLKQRKCIVIDGRILFCPLHLPFILVERFRAERAEHFKSALRGGERLASVSAILRTHPSVGGLLDALPHLQTEFGPSGGTSKNLEGPLPQIGAKELPNVSKLMPPCVRRMLIRLDTGRHLKHSARLQLMRFLKDANMAMEDQAQYWTNRWDGDFNKEHGYTIRYAYGQEGKRQASTMFRCTTMLSDVFPVAGTQMAHGCPFKELRDLPLRQFMSTIGVRQARDIEDVVRFAGTGEYQRACHCTFTKLFPHHDGTGVGNHPMDYYREAVGTIVDGEKPNQ